MDSFSCDSWFKFWRVVPVLLLFSCAPPATQSDGVERASIPMERAPVQLHVRDFGANPSAGDNRPALEAAVEAAKALDGPVEILFEPGAVYRITLPDDEADHFKSAWLVSNATNLAINGQGATLLVTHPEIGGVSTVDSSHITVKNLVVDYDPLPYTQGAITAVNPSEHWFEMEIDEAFLEPGAPCFGKAPGKFGLTVRSQGNGRHVYGPTAVFAEKWEKTAERTWRFHVPESGGGYNPIIASGMKPGDPYIHLARNYAATVSAVGCDHVLWENITVLAGPNVTFYPHLTSHQTIRNCHTKVGEGRILSTNGDGIHLRGSRGHVLIEDCGFTGMADDGINLHSSPLSVQERPAPSQVVVKKHSYSVRPGDVLELVRSASATIVGTMEVVAVEDRGEEGWLLTLDRELPELAVGDGFGTSDNLYNLSESAIPFVIRNCRFNDFRGRGVLLSSRHGVVENNVFNLNEGWGVVFSYESVRWAEGPIARDVTIRNNEFRACAPRHQPAIFGHIVTREGATVESRPYADFKIENNRFYDYTRPVVELEAVNGVTLAANRISSPEGIAPDYQPVVLKNCGNVVADKPVPDQHH